MRLAFFIDQVFYRDGDVLSTDGTYTSFISSFGEVGVSLDILGRVSPGRRRGPYTLDQRFINFIQLPYYRDLYSLWRSKPSELFSVARIVRSNAYKWDAILVGGPNPIALLIAHECLRLGVPVSLIVRQNFVKQMGAHTGLKRMAAVSIARLLEARFRALARDRVVFTVGMEMTEAYRIHSKSVHNHYVSLVPRDVFLANASRVPDSDPRRLLAVGRLAPEKDFGRIISSVALLKSRGILCSLEFAGSGPLQGALRGHAEELGVSDQVRFHGYVPQGPKLYELYRRAGMLVVSSATEGLPQVIHEALCFGLPVVSTAVGGIPYFLDHGKTGLLVPPGSELLLAQAIERLIRDDKLRYSLSRNGYELMSTHTLEDSRSRVLKVIQNEVLGAAKASLVGSDIDA